MPFDVERATRGYRRPRAGPAPPAAAVLPSPAAPAEAPGGAFTNLLNQLREGARGSFRSTEQAIGRLAGRPEGFGVFEEEPLAPAPEGILEATARGGGALAGDLPLFLGGGAIVGRFSQAAEIVDQSARLARAARISGELALPVAREFLTGQEERVPGLVAGVGAAHAVAPFAEAALPLSAGPLQRLATRILGGGATGVAADIAARAATGAPLPRRAEEVVPSALLFGALAAPGAGRPVEARARPAAPRAGSAEFIRLTDTLGKVEKLARESNIAGERNNALRAAEVLRARLDQLVRAEAQASLAGRLRAALGLRPAATAPQEPVSAPRETEIPAPSEIALPSPAPPAEPPVVSPAAAARLRAALGLRPAPTPAQEIVAAAGEAEVPARPEIVPAAPAERPAMPPPAPERAVEVIPRPAPAAGAPGRIPTAAEILVEDFGARNPAAVERITRDELTGLERAEPTLFRRVVERVDPARFAVVSGDVVNLGGLNAAAEAVEGGRGEALRGSLSNRVLRERILAPAARIIEEAGGRLFRTGGDEVAGVVPAERAADVARRVEEETERAVRAAGLDRLPNPKAGRGETPGIVLGTAPLAGRPFEEALREANIRSRESREARRTRPEIFGEPAEEGSIISAGRAILEERETDADQRASSEGDGLRPAGGPGGEPAQDRGGPEVPAGLERPRAQEVGGNRPAEGDASEGVAPAAPPTPSAADITARGRANLRTRLGLAPIVSGTAQEAVSEPRLGQAPARTEIAPSAAAEGAGAGRKVQAEIPSSEIRAEERGTPVRTSPVLPEGQGTQRPSTQTSTIPLPGETSTRRIMESSSVDSVGSTRIFFDDIDSTSTHNLSQPTRDIKANIRAAEENLASFREVIVDTVRNLPGTRFEGARIKGETRAREKAEKPGKTGATVRDYLAARIAADTPEAMRGAVAEVRKRFGSAVARVKNTLDEPSKYGWRDIKIGVRLADGHLAEIQIVPTEILEAAPRARLIFERYRAAVQSPMPSELAESRAIYDDAFDRFVRKGGPAAKGAAPRGSLFEVAEVRRGALAWHEDRLGATLRDLHPGAEIRREGEGAFRIVQPGGLEIVARLAPEEALPWDERGFAESLVAKFGGRPLVGEGGAEIRVPGSVGEFFTMPRPTREALRNRFARAGAFIETPDGTIDADGIAWLAKGLYNARTVDEETVFHAAWRLALTDAERAAAVREFGSEEAAGQAYRRGPARPRGVLGRIYDFFRRLYEALFGPYTFDPLVRFREVARGATGETVLERIRSREVFSRPAGAGGGAAAAFEVVKRGEGAETLTGRVKKQIVAEKEPTQERPLLSSVQLVREAVLDDLFPIEVFERAVGGDLPADRSAEILARASRGMGVVGDVFVGQMIGDRFTGGPVDWDTLEIRRDVPSLAQALDPVLADEKDFEAYLVLRRARELAESRQERLASAGRSLLEQFGAGFSEAEAEIGRLEAKYPEFAAAAANVSRWNGAVLDYLAASKRYPDEVIEFLRTHHQNYVPLYRALAEEPARFLGEARTGAATPFRRIAGGEQKILSPLRSLVGNAHAIARIANQNEVIALIVDAAEGREDLAPFVRPVETRVAPTRVQLAEIQETLGEAGADLNETDLSRVATIFRPVRGEVEGEVQVFRGGEAETWQFDPALWRAVRSLDRSTMPVWLKFLTIPLRAASRVFRAGVVLTPDFQVAGAVRDQANVAFQGGVPFEGFARGFLELAGRTDLVDRWKASGGAMFSMLADREALARRLRRPTLRGKFGRIIEDVRAIDPRDARSVAGSIVSVAGDLLGILGETAEFTEAPTRIGRFKRAIERPLPVDISAARPKRAVALRAAVASREVSVDFLRRGGHPVIAAWTQVTAFVNPAIQGADQVYRTFRRDPRRAVWLGASIMLAEFLLYLHNKDEKYRDSYDAVPEWLRDVSFVYARENGRPAITLMGGFEWKILFGAAPRRIFEFLEENDPAALEKIAPTLSRAVGFNVVPSGAVGEVENYFNYNFFTGRPIVPEGLEEAAPQEQATPRTSELARRLGRVFGYPPVKIDNLIRSHTGPIGSELTRSLDGLLREESFGEAPAARLTDLPVIRRFLRSAPSASSVSVEKFYDILGEARETVRTRNILKEDGRLTSEWERDNSWKIAVSKSFEAEARRFREARRAITAIEQDPALTGDEKRKRIDAATAVIVGEARKLVEAANTLRLATTRGEAAAAAAQAEIERMGEAARPAQAPRSTRAPATAEDRARAKLRRILRVGGRR